jgi:hypothetical protein
MGTVQRPTWCLDRLLSVEVFASSAPRRSRMLKKASSFVLASLRGSTYMTKYASPHRSLRPRWTAFLSILALPSPPAHFERDRMQNKALFIPAHPRRAKPRSDPGFVLAMPVRIA